VPNPPEPPKGSPADSKWAQQLPNGTQDGSLPDNPYDARRAELDGDTVAQAQIVYRDLPLVNIATDWSPDGIRAALRSNMTGNFYSAGDLCDAILGDDRVQATMGSRVSALLGRETIFEPANDSAAAKEVLDAWIPCWPRIGGYNALGWGQAYATLQGWALEQLVWDTSGPVWTPTMVPWHSKYSYYHWYLRRFIALGQEGQIVVEPGNSKWVLHAPWGDYRPWVFGAMRAVAEPWLGRHYAYRDWMRFSEVHGIPIKKASCPVSATQDQRNAFMQALAVLPSETTVLLGKGLEGQGSDYDLELLEAKDTSWESFPGLIDRSDMSIILALMFQNLTTEVTGGSFKATESHMDVREDAVQRDDKAWQKTIREQVARPFAFLNYGDPDLAPKTRFDVQSTSTHNTNARLAALVAQMIQYLRTSGVKVKDVKALFGKFGIDVGDVEDVSPLQVEAKLAGQSGEVTEAEETKAPSAPKPPGAKEGNL
jgi:phage gp29-like protein